MKYVEIRLWTAPESWAVEKESEEAGVWGDSSSKENTRDATSSFSSCGLSSKRKYRRKSNHTRKLPSHGSNDLQSHDMILFWSHVITWPWVTSWTCPVLTF
jgi:hypothetical protein